MLITETEGPGNLQNVCCFIDGIRLRNEFIDASEEKSLIQWVDMQTWDSSLRRRVQHYGYRYDYNSRGIDSALCLGNLPNPLLHLATRLVEESVLARIPDQVIINEYDPGQGISQHIDCVPCFGPEIAIISLGSHAVMDFTKAINGFKASQILLPRSLLILENEGRYDWKHGISSRKSDLIDGERVLRERRISLTFRFVLKNS